MDVNLVAASTGTLGVAVGSIVTFQTSIAFTALYPPYSMGGTYSTLPGNQPTTYQNYVAVWGTSVVPWSAAALAAPTAIPSNYQSANFTVSNLQLADTTYIIGYGVGPPGSPDWPAICASAVVNQGGQAGVTDRVSLTINSIGSTSLAVNYHTLSGYQPGLAANWIGLWTGQVSPYFAGPPMATVMVTGPNEGTVVMNQGVFITVSTTYTLIYFMGGPLISSTIKSNSLAAAILQFTTSSTSATSVSGISGVATEEVLTATAVVEAPTITFSPITS